MEKTDIYIYIIIGSMDTELDSLFLDSSSGNSLVILCFYRKAEQKFVLTISRKRSDAEILIPDLNTFWGVHVRYVLKRLD